MNRYTKAMYIEPEPKTECSPMFGKLQEDLKQRGIEVSPDLHHASKYHDPSSYFYIGTGCVNCHWADLEARLEAWLEEKQFAAWRGKTRKQGRRETSPAY